MLTDLRYKLLGLTVMYIPRDGCDLTISEAVSDKELVKRLEQVVVGWTRQIKTSLGDQDQTTPRELLCPRDEYEFWVYRC